jgi:EpsI family protein
MNRKHTDTASNTVRRRSVAVAAIAASFLMLIFGLGYHVLAARLEAPVNTITIPPAALERFPLQIGDWIGQDVPMDEAVIRATDTDALINRRYSRRNGQESVSLYVAYGVRARELMPHRPEVCYPGSGWTRTDRRSMELSLRDGMQLPCRILQFSRGTLNTEKVLVLNYYIVDGQYCGDVSLLRSKAWRGSGTVRYAVQVQIVASVTDNMIADSAARMVCDFAVESASSIFRLFESAEESQHSDEDGSDSNRMFGGGRSG